VMLYECATGKRPFAGESHYALMHAIVTSPVVTPTRLNPSLPLEFDALVLRAMHRDPAQRFPSVRALGSALLALGDRSAWALWESEFAGKPDGDQEPWGAEKTLADAPGAGIVPAHTARYLRRRRRLQWLVAVLALYALAITSLLAMRRNEPSASSGLTIPARSAGEVRPPTRPSAETPSTPPSTLPGPAFEPATTRIAPEASAVAAAAALAAKPPRGKPSSKPAATPSSVGPTIPGPRSTMLGTNGAPIVE
jgi:eukaryotic-like serine/threonine-protein kinase